MEDVQTKILLLNEEIIIPELNFSWVYDIVNYHKAGNLPKYGTIKLFAGYFSLDPSYFYEWRLKKLLDFIDKNRRFLDVLDELMIKYKERILKK